jgi:hypothetical protein
MAVIISARQEHLYDVPIEEARHGPSFFQVHFLEDAIPGNSPRAFPGFSSLAPVKDCSTAR